MIAGFLTEINFTPQIEPGNAQRDIINVNGHITVKLIRYTYHNTKPIEGFKDSILFLRYPFMFRFIIP